MEHLLTTIFTIILIMELIIGVLGNGFMALVNFMDWLKRRQISLVNQILMALATSRICLLWLLFSGVLSSLLYSVTMMARMVKVMANLWIIANHFSIWLATCLSVFYFLKIANFNNSLFLYLKWRVKKVVSVTLLLSMVPLFLNILLVNLEINVCISEYQTNISCNFSSHYKAKYLRHVLSLHTSFLSVPFSVTLTSFLLLIFSLWRHHKNMQQHVHGCRDALSSAHLKALHSVVAFLLLYMVFILSLLLQLLKYELLEKNLFTLCCYVVYIAFPSFHSCILILGDMKLRQACLSVLCWLKCRFNYMETLDL